MRVRISQTDKRDDSHVNVLKVEEAAEVILYFERPVVKLRVPHLQKHIVKELYTFFFDVGLDGFLHDQPHFLSFGAVAHFLGKEPVVLSQMIMKILERFDELG